MKATFRYLNHNGKDALRSLDVTMLEYHFAPNYGYQPGWAIHGFDYDKAAQRTFFLDRIRFPDSVYNIGPGYKTGSYHLLSIPHENHYETSERRRKILEKVREVLGNDSITHETRFHMLRSIIG